MLGSFDGKGLLQAITPSDRKLRLFGCACCWRILESFPNAAYREALEQLERHIDDPSVGKVETRDLFLTSDSGPHDESWYFALAREATARLFDAPGDVMAWDASFQTCVAMSSFNGDASIESERSIHANLLRDIFGNPFRPVALDPRWLTTSVLDLARIIYDERAFERMPILADALMDAGCDNDDILNHCRGAGPHVRGCWVVDLLLGKE
jgi:hypothetical protein